MSFTNEEGEQETDDLTYNRQDFWNSLEKRRWGGGAGGFSQEVEQQKTCIHEDRLKSKVHTDDKDYGISEYGEMLLWNNLENSCWSMMRETSSRP
jgi:hypothetical protein